LYNIVHERSRPSREAIWAKDDRCWTAALRQNRYICEAPVKSPYEFISALNFPNGPGNLSYLTTRVLNAADRRQFQDGNASPFDH